MGNEESRRQQARLHEELAQREKTLRDARIRNIHEVEELKRAQEMRIDEFSRNEWRVSHATFQEHTSSDSNNFQDVESTCSGKFSNVPSQRAIVTSLCGMLRKSRFQSLSLPQCKHTWFSCEGECLYSLQFPVAP